MSREEYEENYVPINSWDIVQDENGFNDFVEKCGLVQPKWFYNVRGSYPMLLFVRYDTEEGANIDGYTTRNGELGGETYMEKYGHLRLAKIDVLNALKL